MGVSDGRGKRLQYLSGDALTDAYDCLGPEGQRYPHEEVAKYVHSQQSREMPLSRSGRALNLGSTADPWETQKTLLSAHRMTRDGLIRRRREAEDDTEEDEAHCTIGGAPPRLCKYEASKTIII